MEDRLKTRRSSPVEAKTKIRPNHFCFQIPQLFQNGDDVRNTAEFDIGPVRKGVIILSDISKTGMALVGVSNREYSETSTKTARFLKIVDINASGNDSM
jgi:hypothetical protein